LLLSVANTIKCHCPLPPLNANAQYLPPPLPSHQFDCSISIFLLPCHHPTLPPLNVGTTPECSHTWLPSQSILIFYHCHLAAVYRHCQMPPQCGGCGDCGGDSGADEGNVVGGGIIVGGSSSSGADSGGIDGGGGTL
jgi:hypothetical protein